MRGSGIDSAKHALATFGVAVAGTGAGEQIGVGDFIRSRYSARSAPVLSLPALPLAYCLAFPATVEFPPSGRPCIAVATVRNRSVCAGEPHACLRHPPRATRAATVVAHAHDEYAIGVVDAGRGRIEHALGADGHPAGSIVVIPPGLVHAGSPADERGFCYRMLYLPVAYLEQAARDAGLPSGRRPWFPRTTVFDAALAHRIGNLHAALDAAHNSPAHLANELACVLRDLTLQYGVEWTPGVLSPVNASPEVQAVRAAIQANYARPQTIEGMSRLSGLSPFYLIRAFRRAYGLPPYMYVEHLRVQRARQLIEQGESIVHAALEAGFSDQSHLTRRFKRTYGITPGVIARRAG